MTSILHPADIIDTLVQQFYCYIYIFVYSTEAERRRWETCYDIKPVRKEEGKSYWKIPLCDDDATREK